MATKQLSVDDFRDVLLDNPLLKNCIVASPDLSLKYESRREIKDKFNAIRKVSIEDTIPSAVARVSQTPFIPTITSLSRPLKFNMPILRMFDRKTNLEEHAFHYIEKMNLETDDELLMCRLFLSSL